MNQDFSQFNLHPNLVQAVIERGYETPTPIQTQVIPVLLDGSDVIGQAQTGTGKTAAFALPMLHNLVEGWEGVQGLVVTPTRELASQVAEAIASYGRYQNIQVLPVYGGQHYGHQIRQLKNGVEIVVGTPGRLLDLIKRHALDLSATHMVILDEADEMLSMGFIDDIEAILTHTPETRQTALFSATMPAAIRNLADHYLHAPQLITIQHKKHTVESIEQRYYLVNPQDKTAALTRIFEGEAVTSMLIFTKTRIGSDELANHLAGQGYNAEALNGDLNQDARERVLDRFKSEQVKVLVATDVAARGLDIDDISHVVNYDLPYDVESYVHRIGRTGRAGKTGIAISLVTPNEQWRLGRIEKFTHQPISKAQLPTREAILQWREERLIEQINMWLRRDRCRREQEIVADLVAAGHDPAMIAAVALKLARAEEKQRSIAEISEVAPRKSRTTSRRPGRSQERTQRKRSYQKTEAGRVSHETGMLRLSLGAGRKHGVRPADVVSAIARRADIPGATIGKILIQEQHTLVDIPTEYASQVLSKTGTYRLHKLDNVIVQRAA